MKALLSALCIAVNAPASASNAWERDLRSGEARLAVTVETVKAAVSREIVFPTGSALPDCRVSDWGFSEVRRTFEEWDTPETLAAVTFSSFVDLVVMRGSGTAVVRLWVSGTAATDDPLRTGLDARALAQFAARKAMAVRTLAATPACP